MKLLSLNCNHCGAGLEVNPKINYFNCSFCGSQLKLIRSGNTLYTDLIENLNAKVEQISEDTNQIKIEQEIERLDRAWEMRRRDFESRGKRGTYQPTKGGSIGTGIILLVFGILWMIFTTIISQKTSQIGGSLSIAQFFPFIGVLMIIAGIFRAFSDFNKAEGFQEAKADYEQKRKILLQKLKK